MAQVILVHSNPNVRDLITLNLTTYTNAHIIPRNNAEDAITLIDILPNIDLVIAESKIDGEPTCNKLFDYANEHNSGLQFVFLGNPETKAGATQRDFSKNSVIIQNILDWQSAVDAGCRILGVNPEDLKKKKGPVYASVTSQYFHVISNCPCDVYIRIKQGPGSYQYIKRIHRGDNFSVADIERYESQGLKFFHILEEDMDNFTTFLSNSLVHRLEQEVLYSIKDEPLENKIPLLARSYDLAMHSIVGQGLNASTIQLADAVIQSMLVTTNRSPMLGPLFRQVLTVGSGRLYKKAQVTLLIAFEVMKLKNVQAFGLDNKEDSRNKIAYSSFFCDLSLFELARGNREGMLDDLAFLDRPSDIAQYFKEAVSKSLLTNDEAELFQQKLNNHALESAVFIRRNPEAPLDSDTIIRHHHGSLNGTYFKQEYEQLPALSRLFILAESFARQFIINSEKKKTDKPVILDIQEKFKGSASMEVLIKALQDALKSRE